MMARIASYDVKVMEIAELGRIVKLGSSRQGYLDARSLGSKFRDVRRISV